jgi:hypothetical protein
MKYFLYLSKPEFWIYEVNFKGDIKIRTDTGWEKITASYVKANKLVLTNSNSSAYKLKAEVVVANNHLFKSLKEARRQTIREVLKWGK